jgi:hypothetical protein
MQIPNANMEVYESVMNYTGKTKKSRRNPLYFLEILTSKTYVNTGKTN